MNPFRGKLKRLLRRFLFGHGGMQCCSAFADPERGFVAAIAYVGLPGEPRHNSRVRDFHSAVYEDLGLVMDSEQH